MYLTLFQSETDKAKQDLNANNEFALKEGAFGLPWFIALNSLGEKDVFWGFDHIGMVAEFLGLRNLVAGSGEEAAWRSLL